jgi:hypothetical protein
MEDETVLVVEWKELEWKQKGKSEYNMNICLLF